MLPKTLDFSCIPLLEPHLPKHPASDVLQVRNYLGCGMQQAKLYLWFAGGDPTEAIRWVSKTYPRASSPRTSHLLIKAEKGILTDQEIAEIQPDRDARQRFYEGFAALFRQETDRIKRQIEELNATLKYGSLGHA